MKIGQKLFAILLAISMALSISACGSEKNNGDSSTAEVTTTALSETAAKSNNIIEKGNTVIINNEEYDVNATEVEIKIANQEHNVDVSNLEYFTNLKSLGIYNAGDGGATILSLEAIQGLNSLEAISLGGVAVSDEKYNYIGKCKNLKKITMSFISIKDISWMKDLKNLETVDIWNTDITDLSALSKLDKLTDISIGESAVTDFSPLEKMTQLNNLNISCNSGITDEQLEKLKKSLPNCEIK